TDAALYSYTPKTQKWEEVTRWRFGDLPGLAYEPATDRIYLLAANLLAAKPTLHEYDAAGEPVGEVALTGPLFPGVFGTSRSEMKTQLLAVGDMLVLVTTIADRAVAGWPIGEMFVYLIDPKT